MDFFRPHDWGNNSDRDLFQWNGLGYYFAGYWKLFPPSQNYIISSDQTRGAKKSRDMQIRSTTRSSSNHDLLITQYKPKIHDMRLPTYAGYLRRGQGPISSSARTYWIKNHHIIAVGKLRWNSFYEVQSDIPTATDSTDSPGSCALLIRSGMYSTYKILGEGFISISEGMCVHCWTTSRARK